MPVIPNRETAWPLRVYSAHWTEPGRTHRPVSGALDGSLNSSAHLTVMKTEKIRDRSTNTTTLSLVDDVLSLTELCTQLQVSAQTIYDLRSQGRGPRGFRVGRELRRHRPRPDGPTCAATPAR